MRTPLGDLAREERCRVLCRRVAERVREVTPSGLGRWDPALELVREPSDGFLDALDAWLDRDDPDTRARLRVATGDLVRAWREAGRRWEAEGRPGAESAGRRGVPA